MLTVVTVPFHQDERLGIEIELPDGTSSVAVDPTLPDGDQWSRLGVLYEHVADQVASHLSADGFVAVVSGDCLAQLGTLAGVQRAGLEPSLVWFDAHGDLHTLETSQSGYLGGMPLRMVLGGDADRLTRQLGVRPLTASQVLLVDARDLDPAEVEYLSAAGIRRRAVDDIRVEDLPDGPVIVHVDLDVIDANQVPGVRFPVPDGPSRHAVAAAVRRLLANETAIALHVTYPWLHPPTADQAGLRRHLLTEILSSLVDRQR